MIVSRSSDRVHAGGCGLLTQEGIALGSPCCFDAGQQATRVADGEPLFLSFPLWVGWRRRGRLRVLSFARLEPRRVVADHRGAVVRGPEADGGA